MNFIDQARLEMAVAARDSVRYCRAEGIDWEATLPATGGVFLADILPEPNGRFGLAKPDADGAIEAAFVECIEADGETVADIVAWPVADPNGVMTMFGRAPVLGVEWATNPSSYFMANVLRLYRTPLSWLQNGCQGLVLLNPDRGAHWLIANVTADPATEDPEAGDELAAALTRAALIDRILIPNTRQAAA